MITFSIKKLGIALAAGLLLLDGSASAALTTTWDFSTGNTQGWTVISGFENYNGGGIQASQNNTNNYAHDAAHPNFVVQSPLVNFGWVGVTDPVIEIEMFGGAGNQSGSADPTMPSDVVNYNGGNSDTNGQKGFAFLNLTTGMYDEVLYDSGNGGGDTFTFTAADLATAGINTTDTYALQFYDNDQGSWGWTRLSSVSIDSNAIPEPSRAVLLALGLLALIGRRRRR